jgi:hypothetical protein
MEPVNEDLTAANIRQEVDDALLLLQHAIANGIDVAPVVVEEILRAAAETYPDVFDAGDVDFARDASAGNTSEGVAAFMRRLNAEIQASSSATEVENNG